MKSHKAFTLVELLIVIALIGLLSAITIPQISSYYNKSKDEIIEQFNGNNVIVICGDNVIYEGKNPDLTGYTILDIEYKDGVVYIYVKGEN